MSKTIFYASGDANYLKGDNGNRRYIPVQRVLPATMHYTNPRLEAEIEKLIK